MFYDFPGKPFVERTDFLSGEMELFDITKVNQ